MMKKKKETAPIELQDMDAQALMERRRRVLYIGNQIRDRQLHGGDKAPAEPVLSLRYGSQQRKFINDVGKTIFKICIQNDRFVFFFYAVKPSFCFQF